ncbi:MAG: TldD/PmbA family protein [Candidatus Cloacimonetes bacterium]|nr:TldD/PmbA family protein [Candidatus Cloacimonadota bacterium]
MIKRELMEKIIEKMISAGADFAEIFFENTNIFNIHFLDEKPKNSLNGADFGVGLRAFYGKTAIYAYTNDISEAGLLKAAKSIESYSSKSYVSSSINLVRKDVVNIHPLKIKNDSITTIEKIDFLRKINDASRKMSPKISQVELRLVEKNQKIVIANSEGLWTADERNYSRISVTAVAYDGKEKQTGGVNPGASAGYEFFRSLDPVQLGEESARMAITMLSAEYAPSGKFPVIIDNGFGGVIFHEASGHSLEATSVAKNASVFSGKMGEKIANEAVTAIDDGTMPNKWGSSNIDDEGVPTQRTVLIEKGILKSYMIDKLGGIKMGMDSTGSGRRQSYRFAPTSRMRNTYIAPGKFKLDDLIASVDYGIYAKKMGGGSVSPGTGDFNFSVSEGYIIKNGKVTKPVRGATLIGNGANSLHKISMVADNLDFAEGMCGSVSGSIPTCVGQPAIKIDEIIVGGRDGGNNV